MAVKLIEHWGLAVLRVRLDPGERVPTVTSELLSYAGGSAREVWTGRYPLADFGLTDKPGPPHGLRVPSDLSEAVAEARRDAFAEESSLWIRLVPPYGYLGAVPWETVLVPVAGIPVFRVPDRLPVTPDPGWRWSVAIGVDTQPGELWSADYVAGLVRELRTAVGENLEVDVFADAGTVAQLRSGNRWQPAEWARLHEPGDARDASQQRVRRVVNASRDPGAPVALDLASPGRIWADWIVTGLAGRAVRALHIVLDTVWDGETPMLALSPDPSKPAKTTNCNYVSGDDLRRLTDTVGAATLSLGAARNRDSGTAMRMIADAIGQRRPGTTIFSDCELDPAGAALAQMHGFLAGSVATVPSDRSLFAYVQPEQVRSEHVEGFTPGFAPGKDRSPSGYDPQDAVGAIYGDAAAVPGWIAASERYVGQELANLTSTAGGEEPTGAKEAYEQGAAEGLSELQAIIAKHARRS